MQTLKGMCYTILGYNPKTIYQSDQETEKTMQSIKIIVEKHVNGYVAYPLGLKGIVVGEGDTYEEALDDVKSALCFHIETFGPDIFL